MTRKLSDSHYVHNQERTSLLPLKRLKITFFTFLVNFQCKWMLWSIDSRTYKNDLLVDTVKTAWFFLILTLLFL